ncbi:hypothetical protein TWF192_001393 [Orbilia oligospora]|uniref:Uncharacterized protein n=1 Tax=Orbilia oligospora TaxID=2813651 RepID=A0A6G1MFY6_ORBOL|nr:hypothetical protein TWF679_009819 [Orbilia oligospora]KAF3257114.1 hypothetical protein TWF192_001393 [Orbilia oligospora]
MVFWKIVPSTKGQASRSSDIEKGQDSRKKRGNIPIAIITCDQTVDKGITLKLEGSLSLATKVLGSWRTPVRRQASAVRFALSIASLALPIIQGTTSLADPTSYPTCLRTNPGNENQGSNAMGLQQ